MIKSRRGFTLVELMTVVVIIGILAAVAVTRYRDTLRRAHEGALRGSLGTLRSALKIYYADTEGDYPATLEFVAQNAKYINRVPPVELPTFHAESSAVREGAGITTADDASGWLYVSDASSTDYGALSVNCTHTDISGGVWASY